MPVYMKMDGIDGRVESATPSTSEIIITKEMDATTPLLFPADSTADPFASYGYGQAAGAHTGGVNVVMGDGSVRLVSDSIGSFSDFDLV